MFKFDISLCSNNEKCPYKEKCLRAKPKKESEKIYFNFSNFYNEKEKECHFFIDENYYTTM